MVPLHSTGPLHILALDPLALDEAIDTLQRFSLVHHHADTTTLNIHRIVQVVLKKELTEKTTATVGKPGGCV